MSGNPVIGDRKFDVGSVLKTMLEVHFFVFKNKIIVLMQAIWRIRQKIIQLHAVWVFVEKENFISRAQPIT